MGDSNRSARHCVVFMMGRLIRIAGAVMLSGAAAGLCWSGTAWARPNEPAGSNPNANSVVDGRYTKPVELDRGAVRVVPAPRRSRPTMSLAAARVLMRADTSTISYQSVVLGYGVATISTHAAGVPRVTSIPAWIGFSKRFAAVSCPMMRATPGSTTTMLPSLPSAGYAAIVIGAAHGSPAVTYVAASAPCGTVVRATLAKAGEAVSIPWVALGSVEDGTLSVSTTIPRCGTYSGSTTGGSARSTTVTLSAVVPDVHGQCQGAHPATESVFISPANDPGAPPPIVTAKTELLHGPLGPQDLEAAPGRN